MRRLAPLHGVFYVGSSSYPLCDVGAIVRKTPFDAPLGAEIIGLDLTRPLSDEDFARIHRAHLDHALLVLSDQRITPEQQIAFSRRFGSLQIHVLRQFLLSNHPEIFSISNIIENGQPIGLGDAGKFWHSDLSYKELPSLGSMLLAQELPEEGGDTLFASQQLTYETLPAELSELGGAARIPLARQDALWEAFCTAADDPLIGLRLGCALQVGHLDMVGALLMSCETVGEALEALLEYYPITLLREPVRLSEVAERLGFSDESAFAKALRRWSNMTLGQFRQAATPA